MRDMAHAQVPQNAEPVCRMSHEQAFGAKIFKEHHELQLKEHDRVNRWATSACIGLLHKLPDEREIEDAFKMTIEVVLRH